MEPGDESYHSSELEKTSYFLSEDDFKKQPTSLAKNPQLGVVTRDNFTATMISTFAYSRGEVPAQLLEFDWMKQAHGFDFERTLQNFNSVGGVSSLTEGEQQQIVDAYWRIKGHAPDTIGTDSPPQTNDDVIKEFNRSLAEFSKDAIALTREDHEAVIKKNYTELTDLKNLSFDQFIIKLKHAISLDKHELPDDTNL